MRNYEIMRNVLVTALHSDKELTLGDFSCDTDEIGKEYVAEIERLGKERLLTHNMKWDTCSNGGTIKGLTTAGEDFARHIQDDSVWFIVLKTLKKSKLDISYPLIQKVCERVAERIVMNCLPEEFK